MSNREKALSVLLTIIIAAVLSGASFYGYYYGKPSAVTPQPAGTTSDPLNTIRDLEKKAQANPQDVSIAEMLGNAYFDLASSLRNNGNSEEAKNYFQKAATLYQKVLNSNPKRVDVQTDMATALYYSDQAEQAEAAYKKAIEINPNYLNAHVNYGIFLLYVSNDQEGARREFLKALELHPSADMQEKIRSLLGEISAATPGGVPGWTNDVEPIIFQRCTSCHGPGGSMARAPLHTYTGVMKYVNPGDVNSLLLKKINQGHGAKLKPEEIDAIKNWILGGAPGPQSTP